MQGNKTPGIPNELVMPRARQEENPRSDIRTAIHSKIYHM